MCAFDGFLLWVRIASACPTIASLCNKTCSRYLMCHFGRPSRTVKSAVSSGTAAPFPPSPCSAVPSEYKGPRTLHMCPTISSADSIVHCACLTITSLSNTLSAGAPVFLLFRRARRSSCVSGCDAWSCVSLALQSTGAQSLPLYLTRATIRTKDLDTLVYYVCWQLVRTRRFHQPSKGTFHGRWSHLRIYAIDGS